MTDTKKAMFILKGKRYNIELIKYPKEIEELAEFYITDKPYTQEEFEEIEKTEVLELEEITVTMVYKGNELIFKTMGGQGYVNGCIRDGYMGKLY